MITHGKLAQGRPYGRASKTLPKKAALHDLTALIAGEVPLNQMAALKTFSAT